MLYIRRGTTKDLPVTIPGSVDPSTASAIWLTFKQNGKIITRKVKTDLTIAGQTVTASLSQTDTLSFSTRCIAEVQIRLLVGTTAYASQCAPIRVLPVLDPEVIS